MITNRILALCSMRFFFFFKQKTAYEMSIGDWSSDVCSSDLDGTLDEPRRSFVVAPLRQSQHAAHNLGEPLPVGGVFGELLAASLRDGIKLGLAIVGGSAPLGGNPSALLQPHERGINEIGRAHV